MVLTLGFAETVAPEIPGGGGQVAARVGEKRDGSDDSKGGERDNQ